MSCKEIDKLLIDYQDDKLDVADRKIVQDHLVDCEHCQQSIEEFITLFSVINQVQTELPGPELEVDFNEMLAREKRSLDQVVSKPTRQLFTPLLKIAATVTALLLVASYVHETFKSNAILLAEMTTLKQEVIEMQTLATLSLLENNSASKRLQAVSYATELEQPNNDVLTVLIAKMNTDKHVNVRLAAANALAKFAAQASVRQALISTLEVEKNANMQLELIQILVSIEEKRAIPTMKKLLGNSQTPSYVKEQINSELKLLI